MVCGKRKASAFWFEARTIQVCAACSVRVLPKLVADAHLGYGSDDQQAPAKLLYAIERSFWRAMDCIAARADKRPPPKKQGSSRAARRRRYAAGQFDAIIGAELRKAADRGDTRAVPLVYEFWRAILAAEKGEA